jgi:hypothetical protein
LDYNEKLIQLSVKELSVEDENRDPRMDMDMSESFDLADLHSISSKGGSIRSGLSISPENSR